MAKELKISKLRMGGGKKRPLTLVLSLLALCAALIAILAGYRAGLRKPYEISQPFRKVPPVAVPPSIVCSRDSMLYYYDLGMQNDPKGLFFIAVGYYSRRDGLLPVDIPVFSREMAEDCLVRSAEKGYGPAIRLVNYLVYYEDFPYSLK